MPQTETDIQACEDEPIRVPGAIQPHGMLFVLDEASGVIRQVSANFSDDAGSVVGSAFATFLDGGSVRRLNTAMALDEVDLEMANPIALNIGGTSYDGVAHRVGATFVIELEERSEDLSLSTSFHRMRKANLRLNAAGDLLDFTQALCEEVAELTGFDRVMVYRFDARWNGTVIAEARRDDLESFMDLRFPATDIPAQARALYTTNWLRIIPTSSYEPVPLVPPFLDGEPLDMSAATLRSVSPVHLQYLRNMGVAASMSVSLVHEGRLWGLIACHNYSGSRVLPYGVRSAVEYLGQAASLLIPVKETQQSAFDAAAVQSMLEQLHQRLARGEKDVRALLTTTQPTVADVVGASGVAFYADGVMTTIGVVPASDRLLDLARSLRSKNAWPLITDALSYEYPDFADVSANASGVIAIETAANATSWIMWFRPEFVRTVTWAGDPDSKTEIVNADGTRRLGPRKSFAQWQEQERRVALAWQRYEADAALEIARHVTNRLLQESQGLMDAARELQESLISITTPDMPGVSSAFRYVSSDGTPIGGDWYDAVALPGGALAVSLGDVAGHGIPAAATMAQLRNSLRAYLVSESQPSTSLSQLNTLVQLLLPSELATGVVASLSADRRSVRVSSAGHLPMLLVQQGRASLVWPPRAPALGVLDVVVYKELETALQPGDAFVFYTDGLVEGRNRTLDEGLETLRRTAEEIGVAGDLNGFADTLIQRVRARGADDDIAIVAIRVDD